MLFQGKTLDEVYDQWFIPSLLASVKILIQRGMIVFWNDQKTMDTQNKSTANKTKKKLIIAKIRETKIQKTLWQL